MSDITLATVSSVPEADSLSVEEPQPGPSQVVPEGLLNRTNSETTGFSSGRSSDSGACLRRTPEDRLNDFDDDIPPVDPAPAHGQECSCIRCYTIMNVDGANSTTDTEADEPEEPDNVRDRGKQVPKVKANLPRDLPVDGTYASLMRLTNSIDPAWIELEAREKAVNAKVAELAAPSQENMPESSVSDPGPSTSGLRNSRTGPRYITPAKNSARNERFRKRLRPCVELLDERPKSKVNRRQALARCLVLSSDTEEEDNPQEPPPPEPDQQADGEADAQPPVAAEVVIGEVDRSKGVEVDDPKDRAFRVRNFNGSDTDDTERDSTDYSDDEDLRNFFADSRHRAVAESNVWLGKGKMKRRRKYLNPDATMSGPESDQDTPKSIVSQISSRKLSCSLGCSLTTVHIK